MGNAKKELECKMLEQKEEHEKNIMEIQNQLVSKDTELDNLQVEFQQINEKNKVLEKEKEEISVDKANTEKDLECKMLEQKEEHEKNIKEIQNQLVSLDTELQNLQKIKEKKNEKTQKNKKTKKRKARKAR